MFYHARPDGARGFIVDCTRLTWMAMDSFFVLSGLLIGRGLLATRTRPDYFASFYLRRARRILPLYYTVLVGILAVSILADGGAKYAETVATWGSPVWYGVFLGNFVAAFNGNWAPVSSLMPLWSLQVEVQFYLLAPLAFRYLAGRNLRRLLWSLALASPLIRTLLYLLAPGNSMIQYVLLPCRMESFALGMLVAERLSRGPLTFPRWWLSALSGAAWAVAIAAGAMWGLDRQTPGNRTVEFSLSSVAAALLVWRLSLGEVGRLHRWIAGPVMIFLARISYGTYVLHVPVFAIVSRVLRKVDPRYLETPLSIGIGVCATIGAAWILESVIAWLMARPRPRLTSRHALAGAAKRLVES